MTFSCSYTQEPSIDELLSLMRESALLGSLGGEVDEKEVSDSQLSRKLLERNVFFREVKGAPSSIVF